MIQLSGFIPKNLNGIKNSGVNGNTKIESPLGAL